MNMEMESASEEGITAEFEYLHNYGWIQSDWAGCVGRISPVLQSSPLLTFLPADPHHNIQITEELSAASQSHPHLS